MTIFETISQAKSAPVLYIPCFRRGVTGKRINIMTLPAFNMRELIEAGVHFGHKTKRWNPRMAPYIYGVRNDIHIIDLGKTVPMLHQALTAVRDIVAQNGRILFVGTKRQATDPIAEAAKRCGQ